MNGDESGKMQMPEPAFGGADNPRESSVRGGFSISYKGKTLLSRIDPAARGERLAREIPIRERTLYLCPSPIYGYGLSLLLERIRNELPKKNSSVLCVEADEKLFAISKKHLEALTAGAPDENTLALTGASDPRQLCAFVRKTWGKRVFRRVELVRLSSGWQLYPELYKEIETALRREIMVEWGNAMTLIKLGRLYARNLIRNLALLGDSQNITALDFGSAPILALGAGPSMDSVLDEISRLSRDKFGTPDQRRFKIICADTCLPALNERGILPDLAVILESQHWNLRDFSGSRGREIDAALDLSSLPASGRVLGGKRYFFATQWTELRLWKRLLEAGLLPEMFNPLGSVGLSVAALALRLGSGPVFTAGIDFSYTLDAYHSRSTPGRIDLLTRQNRFRSAINAGAAFREGSENELSKTGKPVRSDPAMRNYRDLFEQEFGGNPRLLDIGGAGLPLGIKTVSPAEAFAVLESAPLNPPGDGDPPGDPPAENDSPLKHDTFNAEKIIAFARRETETLKRLKEILSGENSSEHPAENAAESCLEELLDDVDYLWAHFPDCAGAGGKRPPAGDLGFLKRVRVEIDPFLKLWEMTL